MNKNFLKKIGMLILSIVTILVLVACGGAEGEESETAGDNVEGEGDMSVAVVINTNLGDGSFSDLVWRGVTDAANDFGFEARSIELMGDATKQIPTLEELAQSGDWDLIVTGTFNLKEAVETVAIDYPDQKFLVYDTEIDFTKHDYENVTSVMAMQNEGTFLAGALGALVTQSGVDNTNKDKVIGFVGGGENSAINDFLVGYIEGAKYIDPEVRVLYSYIGDFTNTAKGKELAISQYQQGADIVMGVAGGASLGVFDAAKEVSNLAFGVDNDHGMQLLDSDPETANKIITSALKNLDIILYNKLEEFVNKEMVWGVHESHGLAQQGMSLADNKIYQEIVPEEIRKQLEEIEEKVVSGEIEVSTAIGMSTEEVEEIKNWAGETE